ncbi:MAG: peptidase M50 [Clostridia bacterium]|nr:peptidase M50 [Clostridia bacterium]
MLEWQALGVRWRLSLLFPALVTALLLQQPDGAAVTCILASLLHEGGHLLAMLCTGCPPHACTVGAFGARLEMGRASLTGYGKNMLISLAGPAVNLLAAGILGCFARYEMAVVHLCLGAFNLLPAVPLDGGEILRCVLCLLGQEGRAERVLRVLSAAVLLPLAGLAAWLMLTGRGNITLLIVSLYAVCLVFFS